jgi:hypothetical protein
MTAWLLNARAEKAANTLLGIGCAGLFVDLGIVLFGGGARTKFYHIAPPDYVAVQLACRGCAGHNTAYVKPWAATLHDIVISTTFICFFVGLILYRLVKNAQKNTTPSPPS